MDVVKYLKNCQDVLKYLSFIEYNENTTFVRFPLILEELGHLQLTSLYFPRKKRELRIYNTDHNK